MAATNLPARLAKQLKALGATDAEVKRLAAEYPGLSYYSRFTMSLSAAAVHGWLTGSRAEQEAAPGDKAAGDLPTLVAPVTLASGSPGPIGADQEATTDQEADGSSTVTANAYLGQPGAPDVLTESVAALLAWVGKADQQERARYVLAVEQARPKDDQRTSLLSRLDRVLEPLDGD